MGIKNENLRMKRTLFIGQAMPRTKSNPHDWPTLNAWLYAIGLTDDLIRNNFLYSALVNYFPGAKNGTHLVPTKEEIANERERLKKTIIDFNPEIVVPIGRLSIAYCLNKKVEPLEKHVGKTYFVNPYELFDKEILIIPFPHPSGASTWRYSKQGKKLIPIVLNLLKVNLYG